ncbi:MAG: Pr6Pr family membrane protein [Microbacteriaceae bacterium]
MPALFEPTLANPTNAHRHIRTARGIRRAFGVLNIVAALWILVSITTQIVDKTVNGVFRPEEYYSYFTIQSSHMNVVVLLIGGIIALTRGVDPRWYTVVRASIVTYAVVTGVVYNLLLRDVPSSDGFVSQFTFPNEVMHVIIPAFIAIEWLLMPGRSRLSWNVLAVTCAYPLVWAGATMIRGALDGWYPYPFLEPFGPAGWGGVAAYIAGIAGFIIALGAIAVAIERAHSALFARIGLDRAAL